MNLGFIVFLLMEVVCLIPVFFPSLYLLTLNSSPTHLYLVFSSLLLHKILHPAPPEPPLFSSPSASVNANTLLTMVTTRRNPVCAKTAPYHHRHTEAPCKRTSLM